MTTLLTTEYPVATDFAPADLEAKSWSTLEPLYGALLERELTCARCLETLMLDRSELDAAVRETHANLYIAMTCHTDDEAAKKAYLDFVENVVPHVRKITFEIDKRINESPHRDGLDTERYGVMLRDITAEVEIFREANIALQTEDTKLGQKYSEICGAMMVQFRGEERTLPQMAKFLEETDRVTREEAWRLVADRRQIDQERLDAIFDDMVKLRHRIAKNAGFDNYRDYMFKAKHRFDYTPADCEAYHRAAEEVCVPLFRKLNAERAVSLGVDPLRPWDLAVDTKGRPPLRPFDSADEMVAKTSTLFGRLDTDLGAMFDSLCDGNSLDLESRKGKAPGGYQESRDRVRRPFIFMNAAGMQRDLQTLIHEAGHAFHSLLSRDEPLLYYRHAPIEFAEVASMSMELLAQPYLDEFYDEAQRARAVRGHLEHLARLIPWTATIDAFQHWIYANPDHSREERTAYWLELDARFGAAVSWDGVEASRRASWHPQLHIFEVPFYYIEYGIAQLGALQLWLQAKSDPARALANYKKAMRLGGSRPLPDLFAAADLEFDFGPATMQRLMDAVQAELETLPE